jgi:hypothetical protein
VGDGDGREGPVPPGTIYGGALGELDQIDQAVYRAIAATPSPSLDFILSRLSSAADHSKLWFAVAVRYTGRALRRRRAGPSRPEPAAAVLDRSHPMAAAPAL